MNAKMRKQPRPGDDCEVRSTEDEARQTEVRMIQVGGGSRSGRTRGNRQSQIADREWKDRHGATSANAARRS